MKYLTLSTNLEETSHRPKFDTFTHSDNHICFIFSQKCVIQERRAFGGPLLENQYIHFRLAELHTEVGPDDNVKSSFVKGFNYIVYFYIA